jgi:hypothetical protein
VKLVTVARVIVGNALIAETEYANRSEMKTVILARKTVVTVIVETEGVMRERTNKVAHKIVRG